MRILILFIICIISLPANATIYKWVDEDGNVVFGDQPPVNRKKQEIKQAPLNTYSEPKPQAVAPEAPSENGTGDEEEKVTTYRKFSITSPGNDEAIRSNSGQLTIQISIAPPLDQAAGHQIQIQLDGKEAAISQSDAITLNELSRGTHTLKATIIDKNGKPLKQSSIHTFHLLRSSVR